MKKIIFSLILAVWTSFAMAVTPDRPNGKTKEVIIGQTAGNHYPRLADEMPSAWYSETTQTLSISFPVEGFEPYTLTVESMYTTLDYDVTTPCISVPIYDIDLTINIQLETESGDQYWGTFVATSTTSTD